MRKHRIALLLLLALAAGAARASADIVHLTSGGKIEGTVVSDDGPLVKIEIRPGIIQTIERFQVVRIERFSDPKAEFARRKSLLEAEKKGSADAWYALGAWALDRKLAAEAAAAFQRTVEIDPDHARAREQLGFERVGREWLPFAEAQRRKGLVEFEGRWVKPEEKEKLEQGFIRDADGTWVKKEALEARKAAAEEEARRDHEAELEGARRAAAEAAREKTEREARGEEAAARRAAGPSGPIKVIQFNIRFDFENDGENRWSHRAPLVAGLVRDAGAEVVCFQEDKTDQVDDLRRLLAGWEFVGIGRNGGFSEHCSVAFDTARWRCQEHGDFWLSDTPEKVASNTWGTKYPHKVTWARLESVRDPESARREAFFLSTHLDEHNDMDDVRQKSARVIRTWLSQHAAQANVVVCGDFNAGTDEAPHAVMLEPAPAPRLTEVWDALRRGDPNTGTCHEFTGKARKKRIDWMFCAGNVTPVEIKIDRWSKDGRWPSDHFALVAELDVKARAKRPAR